MKHPDQAYTDIESALDGTSWSVAREVITGVDCAVVKRSQPRPHIENRDTKIENGVKNFVNFSGATCENTFRPKNPMGEGNGFGRNGQAIAPPRSLDSAGSRVSESVSFGALSSVRSMGTGDVAPVIAVDTEFTYLDEGQTVRRIDSYQFSCIDPFDEGCRVDIVILPLVEGRVDVGDSLAVVLRETGLWRSFGLSHPLGVSRREFWTGDYRESVAGLYKRHRVPLVLAGHYLNADLTSFARPQRNGHGSRYEDILRRVTSASGGLVSLKPVRLMPRFGTGASARWLPLSVTVRDSKGQSAPGKKALKDLGEVCGVPKLDIGDSISDMSAFRESNLSEFLEYGANDSVIVLEYLTQLWGLNAVPPVTLSGGGAKALRDGIKSYWGINELPNAEFMARFQGLIQVKKGEDVADDGHSYYSVRSLTPLDGHANQVHSAFKAAFHGGWNSSHQIGFFPERTFDHDIQSAYPSAMASVVDVDFEHGCIEQVIEKRDLNLDDFPLGPITPLIAYVSWEFPEGVEPCIPLKVEQSIVYPRSSVGAGAGLGEGLEDASIDSFEGAWVCGPELYLALQLGARVNVQIGYRLKVLELEDGTTSRSMRSAVTQMVKDRGVAKSEWGKGSLEEQTLKVAINSCYGKLAQDVAEQRGWNAWVEEMENIGGSSVTSPYHAAMITSLVRALLLAMSNEIAFISVTTDGFITSVDDVESFDCFGLAGFFRDARLALSGDPRVWEVKHEQSDLVNLTTRANVSLEEGGVIARGGLRAPSDLVDLSADEGDDDKRRHGLAERKWFRYTVLSRKGKIMNRYVSFPSFKELSRSEDRIDFRPVERSPQVSLDFDFKRKPRLETLREVEVDGHPIACFETEPWACVSDYKRAREIARRIAAARPGTTGENRPTGCLRTLADWEVFRRRFEAGEGRRIRTADGALLTELVAAHKAGVLDVPTLASKAPVEQKLAWLGSLGLGEFSRAQWDHMSKKNRRDNVLKSADIGALETLVKESQQW